MYEACSAGVESGGDACGVWEVCGGEGGGGFGGELSFLFSFFFFSLMRSAWEGADTRGSLLSCLVRVWSMRWSLPRRG